VAVARLASVSILSTKVEESWFTAVTSLPFNVLLTEACPCYDVGVREVFILGTHPTLSACDVAVTSCTGKGECVFAQRGCVCVYVREGGDVCVCVYVREGGDVCVCVCVCVCEGGRG